MSDFIYSVAHRLADVYSENGIRSVRDFVLKLGEQHGEGVVWTDEMGIERRVSYPAAKNYHSKKGIRRTEAPTYYLARVAKVFGYNLEWLATGKGDRTPAESRGRSGVGRSLIEQLKALRTPAERMDELFRGTSADDLLKLLESDGTRWKLADVFGRWHGERERFAELTGGTLPTVGESAAAFADLLAAPVDLWRGDVIRDIHPDRVRTYVDAMLSALALVTPDGRDFAIRPFHTQEEDER
jgi:hypothetical protein